jgi:leucyl aminopeptidase
MEIQFSKITLPEKGAVVFLVGESLELGETAKDLDRKAGGVIEKAIKGSKFTGKKGKVLPILSVVGHTIDAIVLIGMGKEAEATEATFQSAGGALIPALNGISAEQAVVVVENGGKKIRPADAAANIAFGAGLRSYRFDKYFTKLEDDKKPTLKKITVALDESQKAAEAFKDLDAIRKGVFLTRDVVSEPPNILYPESYANRIKRELTPLGIKVEILGIKEMKKLGMGSLLGVGQGSVNDSRLVVMQYNGAKGSKKSTPVAFVGKGVTFDTGGISIKPANGMEDMKYDMAGSAAVVGLMRALAGRKAKVNAVGVVGLVENMPSGSAQRPSDIVTSMSGQTIEVLNTDAEGRLVLADALWYTQDRFKPKFMVNLATLTGAIVISLGSEYAGLFSNNDELSKKLIESGEKVGEKLWRFPLSDAYDRQIDSKAADMQNIGNERGAGSITAAQFLQRFVNKTPWAHLDIAGTAWTKKNQDVTPEGATGYGVRLLDRLVADHYEK